MDMRRVAEKEWSRGTRGSCFKGTADGVAVSPPTPGRAARISDSKRPPSERKTRRVSEESGQRDKRTKQNKGMRASPHESAWSMTDDRISVTDIHTAKDGARLFFSMSSCRPRLRVEASDSTRSFADSADSARLVCSFSSDTVRASSLCRLQGSMRSEGERVSSAKTSMTTRPCEGIVSRVSRGRCVWRAVNRRHGTVERA